LPRLGSRVRIPSPAPEFFSNNQGGCSISCAAVLAYTRLNEPRTVPSCASHLGNRRAECSCKVPGGVPLPSVSNGLSWQAVLNARFDPKCGLAGVANPPLHGRPDSRKALNGPAAKHPIHSADRIAATGSAVQTSQRDHVESVPPSPENGNGRSQGAAVRVFHLGKRRKNNQRAPSKRKQSRHQRFTRVGRAGNALVCTNCGAAIIPKRASRRQRYCSYKCRDEARRARNFAISATTRRGSPLIPRPVQNNSVGSRSCEADFHDRASGIVGPRAVIEVEILGGRKWREVLSPDGVRVEVTRLSRALP
jgi:hypothetical protein